MKCLAVVCMLILLATVLIAQESPVVEKLEPANAWINWERQVIKAVGVGVIPGDIENPQEAERLARQAAGINAYRNIEAAIRMARVHGQTLVGKVVPEVPEIRLKQLAHSAEIVSDRQRYDRAFEVILQVPLSRVAAILPRSDRSDTSDMSDQESPAVKTELVIDARGLDLLPALQPGVFDKAGNEVYSGTAVYSARVTAGDVMKAVEVRDLTDLVVEGQVQAGAQVTILVSPAREPDTTP
jgi:hypothetical protein